MQPQYDSFFASLPNVQIAACLDYQSVENERPFYPPEAELLGEQFRKVLSLQDYNTSNSPRVPPQRLNGNDVYHGGWEQRHVGLDEILLTARELTDWELQEENLDARKADTKNL